MADSETNKKEEENGEEVKEDNNDEVNKDPPYIRFFLNPQTKFDCFFVVGNPDLGPTERIGGSKLNLMAHSEVFRRKFDETYWSQQPCSSDGTDTSVNNIPCDNIPDIQPEVFKNLLRFVNGYNMVSEMSMEESVDLMYPADKYQVEALKTALIAHIVSILSVDNVFLPLQLPECYQQGELKEAIDKIVQYNTKALFERQDFLDINSYGLLNIVQQQASEVTEIELWRAVLRWAKHNGATEDGPELRKLLSEHLKHIRFCTMTEKDFIKDVGLTGILEKDEILSVIKIMENVPVENNLTCICSNVMPRIVTSSVVHVRNRIDFNIDSIYLGNSSSTFIFILVHKAPVLLETVLFKSNSHNWELVPENLEYQCECKIEFFRITDYANNTSTEPPLVVMFNSKVKYNSYIEIPLRTDQGHVRLLANNKYKVILSFIPEHPCYCYKTRKFFSNSDLSVAFAHFSHDFFYSHVIQLQYKTENQVTYCILDDDF